MPNYADIVQISVGQTETQWAKNSYRETGKVRIVELNTLLGKVLLTRLVAGQFAGVVESQVISRVRDPN